MKSVKKDIISWFKEKKEKLHIPTLSWWKRVLLYVISMGIIVLSLLSLIYPFVPEVVSYVFYTVSALLLCASVYYLIGDIIYVKGHVIASAINQHDFTKRLVSDYSYRTVCFTYLSFVSNTGFAILNIFYGYRNQSWWFFTFAVYYTLLSIMRARIIYMERKINSPARNGQIKSGQIKAKEWKTYQTSGVMFLLLTTTLVGTVTLITRSNESKSYSGVLIIAVAAYTFYKITLSIINLFRVRKLGAPLVSVIRYIGYADSLASLVLLQTAMFSSFSDGNQMFERMMNSITGIFACVMVFGMGIYMIWRGAKQ
jgi:hypothetical protein